MQILESECMVLILTVNNLICIGWFIWGGSNFTETANDIQLENTGRGPKLTAYLKKRDGGYRELQGLYLADKIANENGELVFKVRLSTIIYLSNPVVGEVRLTWWGIIGALDTLVVSSTCYGRYGEVTSSKRYSDFV